MPEQTVAERKRSRRNELAERRSARAQPELDELAERLAGAVLGLTEVELAGTVACYVGVGAEPGTAPLIAGLRAAGKRVLLPITNDDMTLDWAEHTDDAGLAPARFGLLEPTGPRLGPDAVTTAEVVLVPALAVDAAGVRLGRGGGCYDRVVAKLGPGTVTCALLYADEILDTVPAEPHDLRVDMAATPDGVTRFPSPVSGRDERATHTNP